MNHAVFLDRDGTINDHVGGYVTDWRDFKLMPEALPALKKLTESDYKVMLVTNQSAVGRGIMSLEALEEIHEHMLAELEEAGAYVDAVYVCTHDPSESCGCRKPETALIDLAAETYDLDLPGSWFVGDKTQDIQAGANAGCKTILVETGYGGSDKLYNVEPEYTVKNILDAVDLILA